MFLLKYSVSYSAINFFLNQVQFNKTANSKQNRDDILRDILWAAGHWKC